MYVQSTYMQHYTDITRHGLSSHRKSDWHLPMAYRLKTPTRAISAQAIANLIGPLQGWIRRLAHAVSSICAETVQPACIVLHVGIRLTASVIRLVRDRPAIMQGIVRIRIVWTKEKTMKKQLESMLNKMESMRDSLQDRVDNAGESDASQERAEHNQTILDYLESAIAEIA